MPARLASFAHLFEPLAPDQRPSVTMLHLHPDSTVFYRTGKPTRFSEIESILGAQKLGLISQYLDHQEHKTLMFYDTFSDESTPHLWASRFAGYDVFGPVLFASIKRADSVFRKALDITDESIACIEHYITEQIRIR